MHGVRLSLGFRGLAVIHSASPLFVGYVVLIGSLCTTEGREDCLGEVL
jgi:hypothetical protein